MKVSVEYVEICGAFGENTVEDVILLDVDREVYGDLDFPDDMPIDRICDDWDMLTDQLDAELMDTLTKMGIEVSYIQMVTAVESGNTLYIN